MEDIIHFITTHYELIINCLLAIVSIVFFFLRKRNLLVDSSATDCLLHLVYEAEAKFGSGHGEDKLKYVLTKYIKLHGLSNESWIIEVLTRQIEKILSTPQKKQ